jgi:hypothetical protein
MAGRLGLRLNMGSIVSSSGDGESATNSTDETKPRSNSVIGRRDKDDEKGDSAGEALRGSAESLASHGGTNTSSPSNDAMGRSRKTLVSSEREKKKGSASRSRRVDEKEKMEAAEKALEKTGLSPSPRLASPMSARGSESERDSTPSSSKEAEAEGEGRGETPRKGRTRREKVHEETKEETKAEVKEEKLSEARESPRKASTGGDVAGKKSSSSTTGKSSRTRTTTTRDTQSAKEEEEKKG